MADKWATGGSGGPHSRDGRAGLSCVEQRRGRHGGEEGSVLWGRDVSERGKREERCGLSALRDAGRSGAGRGARAWRKWAERRGVLRGVREERAQERGSSGAGPAGPRGEFGPRTGGRGAGLGCWLALGRVSSWVGGFSIFLLFSNSNTNSG